MKKILLFCILFASLYANQASEAAHSLGYVDSYDKGIALAKKEHKIMMLVLVRDGCGWCKKFERETLSKEVIQKDLDKGFIKVMLDKHDEKLTKEFATSIVPFVFFVDPDTQKSVWEVAGFKDPADFQDDIGIAKHQYKESKK